jgi:hypothetical protein
MQQAILRPNNAAFPEHSNNLAFAHTPSHTTELRITAP